MNIASVTLIAFVLDLAVKATALLAIGPAHLARHYLDRARLP